jgi:hypothetical protein
MQGSSGQRPGFGVPIANFCTLQRVRPRRLPHPLGVQHHFGLFPGRCPGLSCQAPSVRIAHRAAINALPKPQFGERTPACLPEGTAR